MSAGNVGFQSDWFWKWCLKEFFELLEEGDLLEFDMGLYKHWAIYVGKSPKRLSQKKIFFS